MSTVEVFIASWSGTQKYLPECLASFEKQTKKADFLHVDGTERRAMHKWNERMAACEHDYLALPHADDVYQLEFLEKMCAFLDAHPESVAVFCLDYIVNAQGQRIGQTDLRIKKRELYDY